MTTAVTFEQIKEAGSDYRISLVKLTGLKIVDIVGTLTNEFGEPVFQLCDIVFEDNTEADVEGEHDLPYLTIYGDNAPPNLDNDTLERLYDEYRKQSDDE